MLYIRYNPYNTDPFCNIPDNFHSLVNAVSDIRLYTQSSFHRKSRSQDSSDNTVLPILCCTNTVRYYNIPFRNYNLRRIHVTYIRCYMSLHLCNMSHCSDILHICLLPSMYSNTGSDYIPSGSHMRYPRMSRSDHSYSS